MVQVYRAQQAWRLPNQGHNNKTVQDKRLVLTLCNCANAFPNQEVCLELILLNLFAWPSCHIVIAERHHWLLLSGSVYMERW